MQNNPKYNRPYEVREGLAGREPEPETPETDGNEYLAEVRRMFCEPGCVQGRFGSADEHLAVDWHRRGVSLETVRRAILLGSVRKSMSLLDRPGGEPVRSLRYFASLLEEVQTESFPNSYWQHLEFNLRRCERLWQERPAGALGSARPYLEQADPSQEARKPSSAAEAERDERG